MLEPTRPTIGVHCPKCGHDGAHHVVSSATVVTFTCPGCRHPWAIDVALLPPNVIKQVAAAKGA